MHSSYHCINNSIEGSSEFLISYLDDPNSGDHSWSSLPYQEILQSAIPAANHQITTSSPAVHHVVGQQNAAPPHELVPENGSKILMKSVITAPNSKTIRKRSRKSSNQVVAEMLQIISAEDGTSVAKKLHHNAKERIRRMKLNASYLALQALMPQSRRRSKVIIHQHLIHIVLYDLLFNLIGAFFYISMAFSIIYIVSIASDVLCSTHKRTRVIAIDRMLTEY